MFYWRLKLKSYASQWQRSNSFYYALLRKMPQRGWENSPLGVSENSGTKLAEAAYQEKGSDMLRGRRKERKSS